MPNVWNGDDKNEALQTIQWLAQNLNDVRQLDIQKSQADKQYRAQTVDNRSRLLNAVAQLATAMGPYAGNVGLTQKGVEELGGGYITYTPTTGTKRETFLNELEKITKRGENQFKLQDMKDEDRQAQIQLTHDLKMKEISEAMDRGDSRQALSLMMEYVKTFGATGSPSEIQQAGEAVEQGKKTVVGKAAPYERQEVVATGEKKLLGFTTGEKPITWAELTDTLGSQPLAEQSLVRMKKFQEAGNKNPDKKQAIEDLFFQTYPSLKGRIVLWPTKGKKTTK